MPTLVECIASYIAETATRQAGGDGRPAGEVRLVFFGPPLEILGPVFEILDQPAAGGGARLPLATLLLVPKEQLLGGNPSVGASGRCDQAHLLTVRDTASAPSFLALVPPNQHLDLSIVTAADFFGVGPRASTRMASFDEWWADPFVQQLVDGALAGHPQVALKGARKLVETAARAADQVDRGNGPRAGAWRVLARAMSAMQPSPGELQAAWRLSAACGVPPSDSNDVSAALQLKALDAIASAFEDGFRAGCERAAANADEEERAALADFKRFIEQACDIPALFQQSPQAFYAPSRGLQLECPEAWWHVLTAERWLDLLEDSQPAKADVTIEVANPLSRVAIGGVSLVAADVDLKLAGDGVDDIVLERKVGGGAAGREQWNVSLGAGSVVRSCSVPSHKAPARFSVATAGGEVLAGLKVVSLSSWEPGIYVQCRTAQKVTPAKRARSSAAARPVIECAIVLGGPGRHLLDIFVAPGTRLPGVATLRLQDGPAGIAEKVTCRIHKVSEWQSAVEVDAGEDCELEIALGGEEGPLAGGGLCRVQLTCAEVRVTGCSSEFERLVREHRGGKRAAVQIDRVARASVLESWILDKDKASTSWQPSVLAEDYSQAWAPPQWGVGHGPLFSGSRFISDPRPAWSEWAPPARFLEARAKIFERVRGVESTGLSAEAPFAQWLATDPAFCEAVELYLDEYVAWLANDPDIACWVDVVAVASSERGTDALSPRLDAILLPPVHPLRLAWLCGAQSVLTDALRQGMPCPAAALLDADVVPDILSLAARGPDGLETQTFVAVECNSDYWSVLWAGDRLRTLADRSRQPPFGPELGITVGGLARGFSPSQVAKALGDVSALLPAKPILSISLSSSGAAVDSCNEGIAEWSRRRFAADGDPEGADLTGLGPRILDVHDCRPPEAHPDEPTLSNLVEDTAGSVRWFHGGHAGSPVDLAVITQLEASDPALSPSSERSAISPGAMLRHRVRRQLPQSGQSYLLESRQAGELPVEAGSVLLDKVARAILQVENTSDTRLGFRFSPDVLAIRNALDGRASFVAVSSSAIDPSCFVGEWMQGAYLWDYSLPSYSQRAGDTAGTYLVSTIKDTDREAMRSAVARLGPSSALSDGQLDELLSEVARRGIPTVRELSSDDTKASGALGMFVAARVLQDAFRLQGPATGLLDVQKAGQGSITVTLVVPVDPFKTHLEELAFAIRPSRELSGRRPDLLIVSMEVGPVATRLRIVPLEVKLRSTAPMSKQDCLDALGQATALASILAELLDRSREVLLWKLALSHLVLSVVSFGLRVYGQNKNIVQDSKEWAAIHQRVAASVLGGNAEIEVDGIGRLIVVDPSASSAPVDRDGDGFDETIVLSLGDAARVVSGDAAPFYAAMRSRLGTWLTDPSEGVLPNAATAAPAATPKEPPLPVKDEELVARGSSPASNAVAGTSPGPAAGTSDAKPKIGVPAGDAGASRAPAASPPGVMLEVGVSAGQFEARQVLLNLSDTRLNQLNIGVVGDLGTGKTQLLKSLIAQVVSSEAGNRGIKPRFLIFDYKNDYSSADFVEAVGAKLVKPFRMPLNIFDTTGMAESNVPWLDRFKFFVDVLDKVYSGIGPVQQDKLRQAVRKAYESASGLGRMPTIYDVSDEYRTILAGKTDAPMSIINDMVDAQVFMRDPPAGAGFGKFFDGVVVVSLASMGQDDRGKNMVVALMLNMFYEHMLGLPKRPYLGIDPQTRALDCYLLVDEADNIMKYEFDVLRKLLLQGREFGVGIVLASQYLKHFKVNATDYREPLLTWFVHKVPNLTAAELSGLGLTTDLAELAERVKTLQNHHCLYKSSGSQAAVIRGLPFFELRSRTIEP